MQPHIAALIPRLYRYQFDPNGKIRDAMRHIWLAVLDNPAASLTAHFGAVMAALLTDMGGREWRVRESAARGAADLLQGRHWAELKPHFAKLWTMTLRCAYASEVA
jgi:proteasome component ECM29